MPIVVGLSGGRAWTLVVPHHAHGARVGRQRFAAALDHLLPPAMLNDAIAVVAELLGNAVRHATPLPGGVIRLAWRFEPPAVRIGVTDGGSQGSPRARSATADAVDGRGLAIVSALAVRWGVDADGDGQCVWAELGPLEADADADADASRSRGRLRGRLRGNRPAGSGRRRA